MLWTFKTEPTVVEETSSIYDGIITMFTKNAGTLYVVEGKYLSGIVSRKDFIKAMIGRKEVESLPISMIMTPYAQYHLPGSGGIGI